MKKTIILLGGLAPLSALAAGSTVGDILVGLSNTILKPLVGILLTAALVVFFWGMVKYIRSLGTEKKEGKDLMVWGIVALFVMTSVWGLVTVIKDTILGDDNPTTITVPTVK